VGHCAPSLFEHAEEGLVILSPPRRLLTPIEPRQDELFDGLVVPREPRLSWGAPSDLFIAHEVPPLAHSRAAIREADAVEALGRRPGAGDGIWGQDVGACPARRIPISTMSS
jgi:hypothetical protein